MTNKEYEEAIGLAKDFLEKRGTILDERFLLSVRGAKTAKALLHAEELLKEAEEIISNLIKDTLSESILCDRRDVGREWLKRRGTE